MIDEMELVEEYEECRGHWLGNASICFGKNQLDEDELQSLQPRLMDLQQRKHILCQEASQIDQLYPFNSPEHVHLTEKAEDQLIHLNTAINKIEGLLDRWDPARSDPRQYQRRNSQQRFGYSGWGPRMHAQLSEWKVVRLYNRQRAPHARSRTVTIRHNERIPWYISREQDENAPDKADCPMEIDLPMAPEDNDSMEVDETIVPGANLCDVRGVVEIEQERLNAFLTKFHRDGTESGELPIFKYDSPRKRTLADFSRGHVDEVEQDTRSRLIKRPRLK